MKTTAVEFLEKELNAIRLDVDKNVLKFIDKSFEIAKEMEKQQQGYSEEEVELIANEMVNWAIDNIGNSNPQSGKKFDEVLAKYKNK
jgi:hypothetical protein